MEKQKTENTFYDYERRTFLMKNLYPKQSVMSYYEYKQPLLSQDTHKRYFYMTDGT